MTSDSPLAEEVLALTEALVARPSISPYDAGCQGILIDRLENARFVVERMPLGDVDNFWAVHPGPSGDNVVAEPRLVTSTSGGSSDGRFIAPTGAEVVELGPVNETIHKVNERVSLADLAPLSRIYEEIIKGILLA